MRNGIGFLVVGLATVAGGLVGIVACGSRTVLNQTASLGGGTAGQRGQLGVLFINNTPFRAVFTYGTHSNTDRRSNPDFAQFTGRMNAMRLEGGSSSTIDMLACDRVFSVGGEELLDLLERNGNTNVNSFNGAAAMAGVSFSSADPDSDEADAPTQGLAAPIQALLGADFPCGALLIVRFEQDDAQPEPFRFRADFSMIPARSDR